jgi:tRNA-(ms[2]io[6]A)-hydroxylase
MLNLQSSTHARWLAQVDSDLPAILIDHAHCEKKAAATAMSLLLSYGGVMALCHELPPIVVEELDHFRQVLDLLERRGIAFCPQKPGGYGKRLNELARKTEPERAVDRLLIASLIEARTCERFSLLKDHIAERDAELAEFYGSLFESEARHHTTYVQMAYHFAPQEEVHARLAELSAAESEIVAQGDRLPRMHS